MTMTLGSRHDNHPSDRFIKADLHIHTPESKCYDEPPATAERIVEAAIAAGLGAIAIADHNTVRAVDAAREAGRGKGLAVFPAAELSTKGGHVLALFDREVHTYDLDDFLHCVGAGETARGDGAFIIDADIEDVLRIVEERGGLAIAAHVERWPTGFLQTTRPRAVKMRIHGNSHLSALEITQPENRVVWNRGEMPDFPRRLACVQGSDAHRLDEIGRRPVYLKLPSLDLEGLRLVFSEYDARIRFPDQILRKYSDRPR